MAAKDAQVLPFFGGHFSKDHGFAHVVQHLGMLHRQLLEHPVGQTLKAYDINVHGSVVRVQGHDIFLGLHGKLFRHNGYILDMGFFYGLADQMFI